MRFNTKFIGLSFVFTVSCWHAVNLGAQPRDPDAVEVSRLLASLETAVASENWIEAAKYMDDDIEVELFDSFSGKKAVLDALERDEELRDSFLSAINETMDYCVYDHENHWAECDTPPKAEPVCTKQPDGQTTCYDDNPGAMIYSVDVSPTRDPFTGFFVMRVTSGD